MEKQVYDPFGCAIIISSHLNRDIYLPNSPGNFTPSSIIETPSMVFEATNGTGERFYLRMIEWEFRILIRVRRSGEQLVADSYVINPSVEVLQNILKTCKQTK